MHKLRLITGMVALVGLAGCADDGYSSRGFFGVGFGPAAVWYDGYYGPYPGGYWTGNVFFYADGRDHYRRDEGGHFRRQHFEHAERYKAARPPRGHK